MIKERYAQNLKNYPDYGDVRKYYNEGSVADWVLTHPVSFAANAISETAGEWTKIILKEGFLRYFAINEISSVANKITGGKGGTAASTATSSGMREANDATVNIMGDVIDGNNPAGDIVESQTLPKAGIKTAFKLFVSWIKGLFS